MRKKYKDLAIYFTRYIHSKSIKMLSLHYHELMGKIKEHKGNKYLMVNDYILDKVSDKIKETISIVKFDDTKILMDTDDELPEYITLKNVVILITCVIKDDAKFYGGILTCQKMKKNRNRINFNNNNNKIIIIIIMIIIIIYLPRPFLKWLFVHKTIKVNINVKI